MGHTPSHKFQFHNGSIKSEIGFQDLTTEQNFNSTMVRLKASITGGQAPNNAPFQFHNGSIKSIRRHGHRRTKRIPPANYIL